MNDRLNLVFLSMEMIIPEFPEPARGANFRGGLGILAGDIASGLKQTGIKAIGIIPLYGRSWVDGREISYELPPQKISELDLSYVQFERGGTVIYGLVSSVFNYLYVDDRWQRLQQEITFGKAVPLLLKKLGIKPDIIWLNESHTALSLPGLEQDPNLDKAKILFTVHTPDSAGMERFDGQWFDELGIDRERYYPVFVNNGSIDLTRAGMTLADQVNAVSQEHCKITQDLFPEYASKIIGIRNGSDREAWLSPKLKKEEGSTSPSQLWIIHKEDKRNLLDLVVNQSGVMLDMQKPLGVWVRRIVPYKNQYPLFDPIIEAICSGRDKIIETPFGGLAGLEMQMFCAGLPGFDDNYCRAWVSEFMRWMEDSRLQGNFVFLPDYSFELLKKSAAGCDFWLSCPWPGQEGCGTSDQRAVLNGNPTITTRTGGAMEYIHEFDPETGEGNGFFIEPYDSITLYRKLKIISDLYYAWLESGNTLWLKLRMNAFQTGKSLDITTMIGEYQRKSFELLLKSS